MVVLEWCLPKRGTNHAASGDARFFSGAAQPRAHRSATAGFDLADAVGGFAYRGPQALSVVVLTGHPPENIGLPLAVARLRWA